jgi:type IV pilus assembly protein PilV
MNKVKKNHSDGFTLIEVLVALFVFSVGILGLAGLQAFALKSSYQSEMRTKSVHLAHNIIDKMRANRKTANTTNSYDYPSGTKILCASICDCSSSVCSPENMALHDLKEWQQLLNDNLPGGLGSIRFTDYSTPIAKRLFTVTITWGGTKNSQSIILKTEV